MVPKERFYHPVLPFTSSYKLMFCLCRTNVLTSSSEECSHTEDGNRVLTCMWVMYEERLAVE